MLDPGQGIAGPDAVCWRQTRREIDVPTESIVLTVAALAIFVFFMTVLAYADLQSWRHPPNPRRPGVKDDAAKVVVLSKKRKTGA
jgi:hypothetical protein